jgi:hypothetical protein
MVDAIAVNTERSLKRLSNETEEAESQKSRYRPRKTQ